MRRTFLSSSRSHVHSFLLQDGYDDAVDDAEDDNEDDGSYADQEYGAKPKKVRTKKRTKRRSPPVNPRPKSAFGITSWWWFTADLVLAQSRAASASDSDSDYGARSKKKRRSHLHGDEIRLSSRATAKPTNYVDDGHDFEAERTYYIDPNTQETEENDEIEFVLGHARDEDRLNDPEDRFFDNVVS